MLTKTIPLLVAAASLAVCRSAAAQEPAPGTLLISTAALENSIFAETVLLVLHHDDDGSIAIMINRPTNLAPAEVFPDIEGAGSYTGVLYFGGPVSPARPFILTRRNDAVIESGMRIANDVYLSADATLLSALDETQRSAGFFRIYAGSAQWAPGQLVAEIEAGAWEMTIASAAAIFADDPDALWLRLLEAPHGTEVAALSPNEQTRTAPGLR